MRLKTGINLEVIIFLLSLSLLFATPFAFAAANYGEGDYGVGVYGQASCGDNVCDASESCSVCSADCGICPGGAGLEKAYIEKSRYWSNIDAGRIEVMSGFEEDFGINKIIIESSEDSEDTRLTVRKYHSRPDEIPEAPGIVYKYLQIETENLENLKEAIFTSRVAKEWISENNVDNGSVTLYKYDGNSWVDLGANISDENESNYFYDTVLDSFSYFAISGEALVVTPSVPGVPEEEIPEIPRELNLGVLIWALLFMAILASIVLTIVIIFRTRKKKKLEEIGRQQKLAYIANYMRKYHRLKKEYDRRMRIIEAYNSKKHKRTIAVILGFLIVAVAGLFLIYSPISVGITGYAASGSLPTVGGSTDNWGNILNDYLLQEHTSTGAHGNVTAENLTVDGDVNVTGNVSVGDKITFRLGEAIDNLVDGLITITGNLNITNNLTVNEDVDFKKNVNVTGNITNEQGHELGMFLIETQTASNDATIDFTGIDGSYDEYVLKINGMVSDTDAVLVGVRFGDSGGFKTSLYRYAMRHFGDHGSNVQQVGTNANTMALTPTDANGLGSADGEFLSGEIILSNFGSTSLYKSIRANYNFVNTAARTVHGVTSGYWSGGTDNLDRVQITLDSGNISSGTFSLYGVKS